MDRGTATKEVGAPDQSWGNRGFNVIRQEISGWALTPERGRLESVDKGVRKECKER